MILEALIGVDGRVADAKVLRSVPLLDQAALDAVRQWEYTPTLLNGAPVPVVMTVTVHVHSAGTATRQQLKLPSVSSVHLISGSIAARTRIAT